jgi:hypothetical protein
MPQTPCGAKSDGLSPVIAQEPIVIAPTETKSVPVVAKEHSRHDTQSIRIKGDFPAASRRFEESQPGFP